MSSYRVISKKIVSEYIGYYGITKDELFKSYKGIGRLKVIRGVHVDCIRMALAYYLKKTTPLSLYEIRDLVGYKCHSTIVQNKENISGYIETKDRIFYPYWDKLMEISKNIR